jgi:hypothetical protein
MIPSLKKSEFTHAFRTLVKLTESRNPVVKIEAIKTYLSAVGVLPVEATLNERIDELEQQIAELRAELATLKSHKPLRRKS